MRRIELREKQGNMFERIRGGGGDERREAAKRGLQPLGIFRGFAVAGCDPKEMGIGPVLRCPSCSSRPQARRRHRPVELNEAFACRCSTAATASDPRRAAQRNGGAIALGHPTA